jgi:hypothetical protein
VKSTLFVLFTSLALTACGTPSANDAAVNTNDATDAHSQMGKPACELIAQRCHPYEDMGGTAQMCHRFAEDPSSTDQICQSMQPTCLAACPATADAGADSGPTLPDVPTGG